MKFTNFRKAVIEYTSEVIFDAEDWSCNHDISYAETADRGVDQCLTWSASVQGHTYWSRVRGHMRDASTTYDDATIESWSYYDES